MNWDSAMQAPQDEVGEDTGANLETAIGVLQRLRDVVRNQVIGRDDVIELVIIALIADGHVLLEDFPGSGKTTLAKALGEAIGDDRDFEHFIAPFRRIQFTPDLLPSDVTGVPVFDSASNAFHFRHGPIFAHVVWLGRDQSHLAQGAGGHARGDGRETGHRRQRDLSAGRVVFRHRDPDPLDLVGTYPLPVPQLDRFLFKISMEHIDRKSELEVLETWQSRRDATGGGPAVTRDELLNSRAAIDREVAIADVVKSTLVDISRNLRDDERVLQGNSTRSLVLMLPALQVAAALRGRNFRKRRGH